MAGSVLIDGRLMGYRRGGIANYARQLALHAPGLAPDLEIRVATRFSVPELADRSIHALTPPHNRLERLAFGAEVLFRRPDLLHATDYVHPIAPGVRHVVTVHDLAFLSNPERVTDDSFGHYRHVLDSVTTADRVIAVSESTKRQLVDQLRVAEHRVTVIPNGIDHTIFNPGGAHDREMLGRLHPFLLGVIESGRPVILAVGTIEPRKRTDVLINAFQILRNQASDQREDRPLVVVAGQAGWLVDSTIAELRRLQRLGDAIWIRDIADTELAALYRSSRLLAMPSADEGFGLPALEAMASGTPALVSTNGALPDLVGDSGFIEETDDPQRWADKIVAILADEEIRARRASRGIERAAGYSWQKTARATVDVYREVLGKG